MPQRPDSAQVEFVAADPVATDRELRAAGLVPLDVDDRWRESDLLRIADASPRESERARAPGLQALLEAMYS